LNCDHLVGAPERTRAIAARGLTAIAFEMVRDARGQFPMLAPMSRIAGRMAPAIAHNERWLPWLTREIAALGLTVTPSVGNFILIHFPTEAGRSAKDADAFLTRRGLVLRAVGAYGLPNCLRMTIGDEEANRLAVAALKDFLAGGAGRDA